MRRLRALLAGDWLVSVWTGAVFGLLIGRLEQPNPILVVMAFGGLYALAVHGLMGLFGVRRWGWLVAGVLAGPFPFALLFAHGRVTQDERGGGIAMGMLLGLLLGLVRWAREARRAEGALRGVGADDRTE
jgi:hypothetical protein